MEKALTTPDYYPLSLNALKNACNQTTNRDPIVSYEEATVQKALHTLKNQSLTWDSQSGRVIKYGESLSKKAKLVPRETIILAFIMLKGPQTPGALRVRAERVYAFESLEEVHEVLGNLSEWGFVQQLPRQAGQKELRYTHMFTEPTVTGQEGNAFSPPLVVVDNEAASDPDRIEGLEAEVKSLRSDLDHLKTEFMNFKNQF